MKKHRYYSVSQMKKSLDSPKAQKENVLINKAFEQYMKPFNGPTFFDVFLAGYLAGKKN